MASTRQLGRSAAGAGVLHGLGRALQYGIRISDRPSLFMIENSGRGAAVVVSVDEETCGVLQRITPSAKEQVRKVSGQDRAKPAASGAASAAIVRGLAV
ncbi:hypothetical protein [Streptomyces mirabilis]|uniref:hypothetical protein n=1 Tax=Streptomyces mirabilis TaxID=68239 RepID=UPI0031BB6112